jgi:hypothetical protein
VGAVERLGAELSAANIRLDDHPPRAAAPIASIP